MKNILLSLSTFLVGFLVCAAPLSAQPYSWKMQNSDSTAAVNRIRVPAGYDRIETKPDRFGFWLQHLPLKPGNGPVYLYNGRLKGNQTAHFAVYDIDIGTRDLQQCADAVMRLRAEYLYAVKQYGKIHFNFTSGDECNFNKWSEGYRPVIKKNRVAWVRSGKQGTDYPLFKKYLTTVFMYAGTYSLKKEMVPVKLREMSVGDVFIQGGFPGHAVIVVDMAVHQTTGKKLFLIAQSYMPAQDIHVLKNPGDEKLSPWYPLDFEGDLETPEWTFESTDLRRFP